MVKKKFGGIRQRLGIVSSSDAKPQRTRLGDFFRRAYHRGNLTSLALREGCQAAGSSAGDLCRLGRGSLDKVRIRRGKVKLDSRNSSRAVRRVMVRGAVMMEPLPVRIPLWDLNGNRQVSSLVNFLPTHETLASVVDDPSQWGSIDDGQASFHGELLDWGKRLAVDVLTNVWLLLALWGDSAPYNRRDSIFLLTYRVLSGVHRKRFWIVAMSKRVLCNCGCFGRCTFDGIFDVVAWSFKCLMAGFWPRFGPYGEPLTGERAKKAGTPFKFRAACIAKCGDWSWHKQILGMRGWTGTFRCWMCQAIFNERDYSKSAPWRRSCVCMEAFITSVLMGGQFASHIFRIPGFHNRYVLPDWMHVVCLGILQYLCGNCMWELFVRVGGTFNKHLQACSTLMGMIQLVARDLGVEHPFTALTYGMIRTSPSKKPRMRLKAAEGRAFLPVMTAMLKRFFPARNDREQLRLDCCQALCRCYLEMRTWSDGSSARLERFARQHLLLYVQLGDIAGADSLFWWLYPKHHLFVHVASTKANPALLWNYSDEDEIGACAKACGHRNVSFLHKGLVDWYRMSWEPAVSD
jgi:hypothetical protein